MKLWCFRSWFFFWNSFFFCFHVFVGGCESLYWPGPNSRMCVFKECPISGSAAPDFVAFRMDPGRWRWPAVLERNISFWPCEKVAWMKMVLSNFWFSFNFFFGRCSLRPSLPCIYWAQTSLTARELFESCQRVLCSVYRTHIDLLSPEWPVQGDELAKLKRALYQAVRRLMFHEEGPFECKDTSWSWPGAAKEKARFAEAVYNRC